MVNDAVYEKENLQWDKFEANMSNLLEESPYGFILTGSCGLWNGTAEGGCYIDKFSDLYKFWQSCDYIKIYEEKGHLFIKCSHHDGSNYGEIRELTKKGVDYINSHYYDSDEDVHRVLTSCNFYSKLPHYTKKINNL